MEEIVKVCRGVDKIASEPEINRLKEEIAQLTQELWELEGKFAEEQKQLRQAKDQLETSSCTVVLVLTLVLLTLWSLVEVIFSFMAEITGVSFDKPTFSIVSAVIFLVVFFLILITKPARWLNRARLEQLSVTLNAKEDEYILAKNRIEETLANKLSYAAKIPED